MKTTSRNQAKKIKLSLADEYEQLVHDITTALYEATPRGVLQTWTAKYGRRNKILGASTFPRQIDVSLHDEGRLFLIECKQLKGRVDTNDLLTFAARKLDIQESNPHLTVCAILASLNVPQIGVTTLAKHFGIEIEVVKSAREYGMRLGNYAWNAVTDSARATDCVTISIVQKHTLPSTGSS